MTKQDIADLADLFQKAEKIILMFPVASVPKDQNTVGLSRDLQDVIVTALRAAAGDEEMVSR